MHISERQSKETEESQETISAHCAPFTVLLENPSRDEALLIGNNQERLAAHY